VVSEVVLHLTDLHFGWDGTPGEIADRKITLDAMIDVVAGLQHIWKPTIVCVSGDIGWRGSAKDYSEAETWLRKLLERIGLTFADVLVCAGNHDVDWNVSRTLGRPTGGKDADQLLGVPIARHYQEEFTEFNSLCARVGVRPFTFNKANSYLLGQTEHKGIRFVALNSAWFSKGNDDKNQLWVGLPHIRYMESEGQIQQVRSAHTPPVVCLIHHPPDWWHDEETHSYPPRPNTCDYLALRCHVLLTGHTHADVRKADRIAESAIHLTGGATFAGASHFNSFRLIRIKDNGLTYRSFEFDPRSAESRWVDSRGAQELPFVERPHAARRRAEEVEGPSIDLGRIRGAAVRDAKSVIEQKSRQLKPIGDLPATVPLSVAVRVTNQIDQYDQRGRLAGEKDQFTPLPLYEACRLSRRTVLLGDLGSGKSTLACQLVIDTTEKNEHTLAFFIPAKALRLPDPLWLDNLVAALGAYLAGQIDPHATPDDFGALLRSQTEVCLVVDGLDEVAKPVAVSLFRQLATLVECWPNAQVIATGRPVELAGVSYASWGLCRLDRLSDADKLAVLTAEAAAVGPNERAAEIGEKRLGALKKYPALEELASTPLAVRLLYSRLEGDILPAADSLGDLLYELLMERLGQWSERDQKSTPQRQFESTFKTSEQRAVVLGAVGLAALGGMLGRARAEQLCRERAAWDHEVAQQALRFFEQAGLISLGDDIGFSFQPLLEMAAGLTLLSDWEAGESAKLAERQIPWRVVSFASSAAHRRGVIDRVRPRLRSVIEALLQTPAGVPAACMVTSESRDPELARAVISVFPRLGRRPLYGFKEERFTSNRAIAHTIHLAGGEGFDWFVADYIDARYPVIHTGSAVVEEVLHHWGWFAASTITREQREKLRPMVAPLLVSGGLFNVLPTLAILVPDAFAEDQRLWYLSAFFEDVLFGAEVERQFVRANLPAKQALLVEIFCRRAASSRKGMALYFKLFPGRRPPYHIARGLLRWFAYAPENPQLGEALAACVKSVGEDHWAHFLRWCLTDEEASVAAGAAIQLYELGEARRRVIGDAILGGLHDGGYVRRAEQILSKLVGDAGEGGVRWLAAQMVERGGHNGHSGFWRVLLRYLPPGAEWSPGLLAECAAAVGPFLLARYPEVRDGLQRLLSGEHAAAFRKALRARLTDPDLATRHGCGAILVTCDPGGEAAALFTVVAARWGVTYLSHEWEPFCLSLAFGPSALQYLHAGLARLGREARAFALAILRRNNYPFSPEDKLTLFASLLEVGNWSLASVNSEESEFASDAGHQYLLRQLEAPPTANSGRAAERLLALFEDRLSTEQQAKCWSRLCSSRWCGSGVIRNQFIKVLQDEDYRTRIAAYFADAAAIAGHTSLLEHVAATVTDAGRWRDVLWALIYEQSGFGFEMEDAGQVLLELGRDHEQYRAPMAEAATALLKDPRVGEDRRREGHHWLALLAHEFGTLGDGELRRAVTSGEWIVGGGARAILARLETIPEKMPRRQYPGDYPQDMGTFTIESPPSAELLRQLREWARPADGLHPETCHAVGQLLYGGDAPEEALTEICRQGVFGIMIGEAIRFCVGIGSSLEWRIPLILGGGIPYRLESDRCFHRFHWCIGTHHALLLGERAKRESYAESVEGRMRGWPDETSPLASELLEVRGSLPEDQLKLIFAHFATYHGNYSEALGFGLLQWLVDLQPGATADRFREAAEHGLGILLAQGRGAKGVTFSPYPHLLFPLTSWALGGAATNESIEIYLEGIRLVFSIHSGKHGIKRSLRVLQDFEPLLPRIPQSTWASVREAALTSSDPAVRSLVQMLGGFTGVSSVVTQAAT